MNEIAQIRKLSLWIFFIPFIAINLCLIISQNYELLEGTFLKVDEIVSQLVLNQEPSFKIKEMARKNGMMTMLEDGLQKALDGKTSLHELIEVLGSTRDV